MSRYVDAEPIIKYIYRPYSNEESYSNTEIGKMLDSAPSIDLVRCVECRKVREDGGHANCNGYLYCRKWKTLVDEDDYCSWGEREDE